MKGFTMTQNNKPEWFEIAENDGPATPPKASKTLPVLAVIATALILGVGAVVAQVQENSPVNAAPVGSSKAEVETTAELTTGSTTRGPTDCWPDMYSDDDGFIQDDEG
jgi:hypothetical protein